VLKLYFLKFLEKQDLIDKEIKWKNEKEENVILITEYLEPNLKKYMDNEVILKSTIEELNKEVIDLKQNMEIKGIFYIFIFIFNNGGEKNLISYIN